jgi:hypothetical protein
MNKFVVGLITLLAIFSFEARAAKKGSQIILGVISGSTKSDYESSFQPLLVEQLRRCSSCEVRNLTPYKEDGSLDRAQLVEKIEAASQQVSFLYLHWNSRLTDETRPLSEVLKKLIAQNFLVIGAAGLAQESEPSLPLSRTVLGSAGVVIIGDLEPRERLNKRAYFGPEMLTAIRTPESQLGKGLGSILFVGRLASQYNRKSESSEWLNHFQETKSKTKKLWPGLDDFFGR